MTLPRASPFLENLARQIVKKGPEASRGVNLMLDDLHTSFEDNLETIR